MEMIVFNFYQFKMVCHLNGTVSLESGKLKRHKAPSYEKNERRLLQMRPAFLWSNNVVFQCCLNKLNSILSLLPRKS